MTNSSDSEEHVLETSVKSNYQEEGADDDARKRLGTEAIEQLASGLNLAAHTIEEYSQNVRYFEKNSLSQFTLCFIRKAVDFTEF